MTETKVFFAYLSAYANCVKSGGKGPKPQFNYYPHSFFDRHKCVNRLYKTRRDNTTERIGF